ncbi:hypothetical protein NQZ68_005263 [Dissostichus eleginoides]|nr:hypothetical protein NQZ68_005263 [Dissostichus eleginoides]
MKLLCDWVPLYYTGCSAASIHRRDPTTERHGGFGLLRLRPGPMHPSLDDLVVPSSPSSTISIPNLVRTPDRHSPLQLRSPELKRFASLSLPVTWITGARHRTRREIVSLIGFLTSTNATSSSSKLEWHLVAGNKAAAAEEMKAERDPTTERHGGFGLLRLRPGPMHPSLDDLVVPSSPRSTISIPNLVRTPDRHSPLQLRSPELKRFASLSLPVTWITGGRHRTRREIVSLIGFPPGGGSVGPADQLLRQDWVPLYYTGCSAASIHRRDPTTERHGGFGLLRLRPGPMHPSLDDLVVPSSPSSTISIPNLVRTPDRHSPLQLRSPELKRFASLSLPVTWITGARHRTRREIVSLIGQKDWVPLYYTGCSAASIHRRDPTTERHGGFGLLRLRPGPMHPSLDDLVVPSSPRSTISIPNLVRTPDRHSPLQLRSPELKRFASLSLPVTWITGARHRTRREIVSLIGFLTSTNATSSSSKLEWHQVAGNNTAAAKEMKADVVDVVSGFLRVEAVQDPQISCFARVFHENKKIKKAVMKLLCDWVPLYYTGCSAASIHRRDPTTERHGGFGLLRLRPGPMHPSLDDLVVPSSPRSTISIPNLARTPDRHSPLQLRSPELKRFASLSLPVTWITGARHRTRREIVSLIGFLTSTNATSSSSKLEWHLVAGNKLQLLKR